MQRPLCRDLKAVIFNSLQIADQDAILGADNFQTGCYLCLEKQDCTSEKLADSVKRRRLLILWKWAQENAEIAAAVATSLCSTQTTQEVATSLCSTQTTKDAATSLYHTQKEQERYNLEQAIAASLQGDHGMMEAHDLEQAIAASLHSACIGGGAAR